MAYYLRRSRLAYPRVILHIGPRFDLHAGLHFNADAQGTAVRGRPATLNCLTVGIDRPHVTHLDIGDSGHVEGPSLGVDPSPVAGPHLEPGSLRQDVFLDQGRGIDRGIGHSRGVGHEAALYLSVDLPFRTDRSHAAGRDTTPPLRRRDFSPGVTK